MPKKGWVLNNNQWVWADVPDANPVPAVGGLVEALTSQPKEVQSAPPDKAVQAVQRRMADVETQTQKRVANIKQQVQLDNQSGQGGVPNAPARLALGKESKVLSEQDDIAQANDYLKKINQYAKVAKAKHDRSVADDQEIQAKALADLKAQNPYASEAILQGQLGGRVQKIKDGIAAQEEAAVNSMPDNYFATMTGFNPTGDNTNNLQKREDWHTTGWADALMGGHPGMDRSFAVNEDGTINKEFKKEVNRMAGGNPAKFRDAATSIVNYHLGQYDAAPAVGNKLMQKALDYTHDHTILKPLYYTGVAANSGMKFAARTGTTLGYALVSPFHDAGRQEETDRLYAQTIKDIDAIPSTSGNVDAFSVEGLKNNPLGQLDAALSGAAQFTGEIAAGGQLGKLINAPIARGLQGLGTKAAIGEAITAEGSSLANSVANKWWSRLAGSADNLAGSKAVGYLDNTLSTGAMFAPSMYGEAYEHALSVGYTPEQAKRIAAKNTATSIAALGLGNFAGKASTMEGLGKEILDGAGKDAPGWFRSGIQRAVQQARPGDAARGGIGMGSSAFAEAYSDHQNAINAGMIHPDTPFDQSDALDKAVGAAAIGAITTLPMHLIDGHGSLVGTPQANAVFKATQDLPAFRTALEREVRNGSISRPEADAVNGYVSLITEKNGTQPSLLEQAQAKLGEKASPDKAVQWATEQARLNEVAQAVRALQAKTSVVKAVDADGKEQSITYAPDPVTGIPTEAAGRALLPELNRLKAKENDSKRAIAQLEQGSYLVGRTVGGDELLRLTAANTPDNKLTTDQVGKILGGGPFTTDLIDITEYAKDPEVARYVQEMSRTGETATENSVADFDPTKAHDPIIDTDGSIIDGKKRIAYALANGGTAIQVVKPVEVAKIAEMAEQARQETIGEDKPNATGLPPGRVETLAAVREAYDAGLDREATPEDAAKGLPNATMVALHDAAVVAKEDGLTKQETVDMLSRATDNNTAPAAAELAANLAFETRVAEPVKLAPKEVIEPAVETPKSETTWQDRVATSSPTIKNSELWDNATANFKEGITQKEVKNWILDGEVPERLRAVSEEPVTFEEHPEIASEIEALKTITDEPTIEAVDGKPTDKIEEIETTLSRAESEAESDKEAELNSAIEAADRAIEYLAADQTGTEPIAPADEQSGPAGGSTGETSQQAPSLEIKRGRANIFVPSTELTKVGWSKKGVESLTARLQTMFGKASFGGKGVAVVVVDRAATEKATGRKGAAAPDAWYKDGVMYVNIEHPSLRPSSTIHESAHMWKEWAKTNAPELHAKGIELAQQTPEYQYATARIANSKSTETFGLDEATRKYWDKYAKAYKSHSDPSDSIADEVLAHAIQTEGKSLAGSDVRSQFMKWLQSFWTTVKSSAGFSKMTAKEFANLSVKDFSKAVAEELGSGRALTRSIIEEQEAIKKRPRTEPTDSFDAEMADLLEQQAIGKRKYAGEVDENDQEAILNAANNSMSTGGEEGGAGMQVESATSLATRHEVLSNDPVVAAMANGGADGILEMASKGSPEAYQSALEAVALSPEYVAANGTKFNADAARTALADILARPSEASSVAKSALGIYMKGEQVKLKAGSVAREMFDGIAERINKQGGESLDTVLTGEKMADALSKSVRLQERADAAHEAAKKRGAENQKQANKAAGKTKAENKFVDEVAKRMTDGGDTSTRALKLLANENNLPEADVERLTTLAVTKIDNDVRFSLGGEAKGEQDDRQAIGEAIEAIDTKDLNEFSERAKDIIRNAYQSGFISRDEAGDMAFDAETSRTPESKAAFLKTVSDSFKPVVEDTRVKPVTKTPIPPTPATVGLLDPTVSGVKHAMTALERAKMQLGTFEKTQARSWGKVWQQAGEEMAQNRDAAAQIVSEVNRKPRPLTDKDNAILLRRQIELKQQQAALYDAMDKFAAEGNESGKAKAYFELGGVNNTLQDLFTALEKGGSEAGRALAARKMLAGMDFELANMLAEKRSANQGRELSEGEQQQVRDLNKAITDLQEKVNTLEQAAAQKTRVATVDHEVKEKVARVARQPKTAVKKDDILARIREKLKVAPGGKYSLPDAPAEDFMFSLPNGEEFKFSIPQAELYGLAPEITEMVKYYLESGETNHEQIMDMVKKDLEGVVPEITREEVGIAFSGYGKTSFPSEDALKKQLAEMKQAERFIQAEADVKTGEAPKKSGFQRGKPSDDVRERQRKLRALMEEMGIEVTDPAKQLATRLEAAKTAMRNRIVDLNKTILTRERPVKTGNPVTLDAEGVALKAERDRLQKEVDQIFDKPELTDDQRIAMATKSLDRSIAEYERRIKENDLRPSKPDSKTPTTPELIDLRAKRDALKKAVDDLYKQANPGKTKEELATEAAIRGAEKSIKDIEERLKTGNLDPAKPQSNIQETPELLAARQKLATLREDLKQARLVANPPKSAEEKSLDRLKKGVEKRILEIEERIKNKDYSKPVKKAPVTDRELEVARLALKRKQNEFKRDVEEDRLKNRTKWEKVFDTVEKYQREAKLSGLLTLGKLTTAAMQRVAIAPVEEAVGGLFSKIPGIREIAAKAPREGYFDFDAETNAYTKGVVRAIKELPRIVATGKSSIDELYDEKHGHEKGGAFLHLFGNIHAGLKNPAKQAEFERSFAKRLAAAGREGLDITDELVRLKVTADAYKDSKRAIFMNDNKLTDAWNSLLEGMKKPDKDGKVSISGRAGALAGRMLLPFVKVPTNVVRETIDYATGVPRGLIKVGTAWMKGVENLKPEEADQILRLLKKGSLGAALMLTGYLNPDSIGGYGGKKKDDEEEGVEEGGVRLFGLELPKWAVHNPLLENLQIGATIRKTVDRYADGEDPGIYEYVKPVVLGLTSEIPFVTSSERVGRAFKSGTALNGFLQDQVISSVVPTGLKDVAKATDLRETPTDVKSLIESKSVQRVPQRKGSNSWFDRLKVYFPGLRKSVASSVEESKGRDESE